MKNLDLLNTDTKNLRPFPMSIPRFWSSLTNPLVGVPMQQRSALSGRAEHAGTQSCAHCKGLLSIKQPFCNLVWLGPDVSHKMALELVYGANFVCGSVPCFRTLVRLESTAVPDVDFALFGRPYRIP